MINKTQLICIIIFSIIGCIILQHILYCLIIKKDINYILKLLKKYNFIVSKQIIYNDIRYINSKRKCNLSNSKFYVSNMLIIKYIDIII